MSVALHNTESCMSAIGELKRSVVRHKRLASRLWIKLGAVAFL